MSGDTILEYLYVGGGITVTLLIGLAVFYWIDREWRDLDHRQHLLHRSRAENAENEAENIKPPTPPVDP